MFSRLYLLVNVTLVLADLFPVLSLLLGVSILLAANVVALLSLLLSVTLALSDMFSLYLSCHIAEWQSSLYSSCSPVLSLLLSVTLVGAKRPFKAILST
jgi:hypothetical protein